MKNITIRNLDQFTKRVASLNRRARRLGAPEFTFRVLNSAPQIATIFRMTEDHKRIPVGEETVLTHTVEIRGGEEIVKLHGWQFMARLTPMAGGNTIAGAGEEIPSRFRTCSIECEHCGTNRKRSDSFVLRHDSGAWRQVGRTCLVDFIGHANGNSLANRFAFYAEVDEMLNGYSEDEAATWGGGGELTFDLASYIAMGLKVHGGEYVSALRAEERGIASTVELVRGGVGRGYSEEQLEKAEEIIATCIARLTGESDYEHNALLVARAGYCTRKTLGVGVSLIAAYNRLTRQAAQQARASNSDHVGTLGERREFTLTKVREIAFDGQWGTTVRAILEDPAGNVYTANNLPGEIGQKLSFTATINRHSDFRGTKQTDLSRPAKAKVIQEAVAA